MTAPPPTFEDVFAVMSSVSVGDGAARVSIPEEADLDHLPTRFGIALNILLDDLAAIGERRLRTLLDSVHDYAIVMVDPEGRVTSWNAGAQRVLGYTEREAIGASIALFRVPGEEEKALAELAVARTAGRVEDEGWRLRKDGSRFWANVVVTSILDANGAVVGFAKVTRDLTERRRAEEAVRLANQELEAFSYSVAHDLRSPLRAINGFAQLVAEDYADKVDADGQELIRSIRQNTEKMAGLIDGLLLLARVTRSELYRTCVDLVPLVREIATRLGRDGTARHVELVLPDRLEVDADPRLLRALMENLVGNAWKFTEKVAVARIEVGADRASDAGMTTLFVRDNGAGFDMAFVDKLFGAFQRLHRSDEFPGDGIGLATALRIVQRHGGRIWAEAAVDRGATFYFTLPPAARR